MNCKRIWMAFFAVLLLALPGSQAQTGADLRESVEVLSLLDVHELKAVNEKVVPPLIAETRKRWGQMPPEKLAALAEKHGAVTVEFFLADTGAVRQMKIVKSSGDPDLDRAAWNSITNSKYPALPSPLTMDGVQLRYRFLWQPSAAPVS